MRLHVIHTADSGDLAAPRDAARYGRAAAMSRRRALAAGRSALPPAPERVHTGFPEVELRAPAAAVDVTPPAGPDGPDGQGASNGTQGARGATAMATDGVAPANLGRALAMQRRRQLSQGKQALNGGGDGTATAARVGAPVFILHRGGAS